MGIYLFDNIAMMLEMKMDFKASKQQALLRYCTARSIIATKNLYMTSYVFRIKMNMHEI